jgi:hypothetical protein
MTLAMMLAVSSAWGAKKVQTVYIYGFATSFNDSTVYFTEIQQLDSATIDTKTKFLYSRENYSSQLQDYLSNHDFPNATCVTSFALKRKDAEKKYLKLRERYLKRGGFAIKVIKQSDFAYSPITASNDEE